MKVDESIVEQKLSQLNLVQKIGQLCQEKAECDDVEALHERIRSGQVGSLILASTPFAGSEAQITLSVEALNELQRVAVEESASGIPMLYGRDIIHGHRTVFPVPLGQACAWDLDLIEACSSFAALESSVAGVHWTFSPMLDIARDPRWGRVVEGYGEDPFYVGECGAAAIRGYQNTSAASMKTAGKLIACAKHFIGYGAAEGGRDYNTTEITEHSLHNVYIPPFERALQEGCMTVMSSFNEINGQSASGNYRLLTELLKQQLGFDGFVVSDWASVWEMIEHGLAADESEAARIALQAGVDMEMATDTFTKSLESLVASGVLSEDRIDDAVRRVLRAKLAFGLFEDPYTPTTTSPEFKQSLSQGRSLARCAVQQSVVLLKNDAQLLPLEAPSQKLLLVGPMLYERDALLGTWAMDGNPEDVCTYAVAAREEWGKAATLMPETADSNAAILEFARTQADHSPTIVVFVGEAATRSGENHCISDVQLPDGQLELIEALASLECPLVVVVTAGRPLILDRVLACADALVYSFHGGVEAGPGLVDVLAGQTDAMGRLPVSFPKATGQIPVYYNRKRVGRPWATSYLDLDAEPQFTFGFGLSYTEFELSDASLDRTSYQASDDILLNFTVRNVGARAGSAQVQIYAEDIVASCSRPKRFLVGFLRADLQLGESQQLSYRIDPERLAFIDREEQKRIEAGAYKIYLGMDANCDLALPFEICD
jgi:beta-glucosidase